MEPYESLLADARSFMKSRIILTAVELDWLTRLHEKPSTAERLAEAMSLDLRATTRVLDCLVTFGLLEKSEGAYRPTEQGSYLSAHHPETVLPMARHLDHLWHNWSHLTETVRTGENVNRASMAESGEERQQAFIQAMHVVGRSLSLEIAEDYDAGGYRRLLDIGGASGTYTIAFLRGSPELRGVLFDLPRVVPLARHRLEEEGLLDRVELVEGDFHEDELPPGCDLAFLSAIIHQNSPEENLGLFEKIHKVLEPGGALLIRDHIMDESRTDPPAGALFAINMLTGTRGGDVYTFREVEDGLKEAGFDDIRWIRKGGRMDSLVEGRKPAKS